MFWVTWCVGWCMHILTLFLKKLENFPVWFYLTVSSVYIQESPSLRLNSTDHQHGPLKHRSLSIIPLHHGLKNVPSSIVWGLIQPELKINTLHLCWFPYFSLIQIGVMALTDLFSVQHYYYSIFLRNIKMYVLKYLNAMRKSKTFSKKY